MKTTNQWMLAAILTLCGTLNVQAQTTESGKTVKRVTFNCEKIAILYSDGTKEENVQAAVIKPTEKRQLDDATAINRPKAQTQVKRTWYTLDGRRLSGEPKVQGTYMLKEGNKVRKIIKK
jgi:hypothetical protein